MISLVNIPIRNPLSGILLILSLSTICLTFNPLEESNIWATYSLKNHYQCQRLCWYTKPCARYSFYNKKDNSAATGDNCVLHVNTGQGDRTVDEGWMDGIASGDGLPLSHGCLPRPCSDTEVCIPVYPVAGDGPSAFCRYMPREIKVCDSGPCQNGGSCEDLVSTYTCHCLAGYTGDNCQTDIDECASSPCQNGGSCADQVNVYTCHCPAGFTGDHCENDIDECACGPCQNGGNCTDWVDGFTCDCQAGYTGALCENDIDECASSPCQTGGSCVDQVNAYTCDCPAGFTGDHCETDIDDCACGPCQNGGDCTDWVDGFTCDCLAGYTGALCEYDIDECASSPCQNGGSCVDQVNAYTCDCTNGYAGVNCENGVWLNSACTETCEWNMTACFSGRCLCKDGYYFSHSQYACVRSCAELTQTFLRYENFDLEDHDMSAGGGGRAEASLCKAMCIDNQCKAFVHLYMSEWTSCYFKDGSATEHPGSWISKDVTDTYQRTCV